MNREQRKRLKDALIAAGLSRDAILGADKTAIIYTRSGKYIGVVKLFRDRLSHDFQMSDRRSNESISTAERGMLKKLCGAYARKGTR